MHGVALVKVNAKPGSKVSTAYLLHRNHTESL
jgi:hypothetical protein